MSNPINPDPLKEQNISCKRYDTYTRKLGGEPLLRGWKNCITDQRPQGKDLDTEEAKQRFLLDGCCNEVLQCNNPNEWLSKNWKNNKFDLKCPKSEPSPHPHFGDIKSTYTGEGVI